MSDCCAPSKPTKPTSKHHVCPKNGKHYKEVPYGTVLHHIKNAWNAGLTTQSYYFCDDPNCDVVYFGINDAAITKPMLRTKVGVKEATSDALICYCFDVSKADATRYPQAKAFVVEQTKKARCSCETSNPSGRCCLKDFPKQQSETNE